MSLLALHQLECERDHRMLFTHLDFQCGEGDIVQVEGPNGCGKTTLLRVITGLSTDFHGEFQWRGKLLFIGHALGIKKILSPRENLHWLCGLLSDNTTGNHPASNIQTATSSIDIDVALDKVGLYGFEDIPCYQLSAGQQQRVALARLHLSSALLWVLDEPFTALDNQGVAYFETLISDHARGGGCVLLTAHQKLAIDGIKRLNLADYRPGNV